MAMEWNGTEILTKNNLRIHNGSLQFPINHILNSKLRFKLKTKMQGSEGSMRAGALNIPDDSCLCCDFCAIGIAVLEVKFKIEISVKQLLCLFHFTEPFHFQLVAIYRKIRQPNVSVIVQHVLCNCSNFGCHFTLQ